MTNLPIQTLSKVQLYLNFPIKIFFLIIAKEFGRKCTVKCHVANNGDLVIIGVSDEGTIFEFKIGDSNENDVSTLTYSLDDEYSQAE